MSDMQFNDNLPRYGLRPNAVQAGPTGMAGFLIKHGIVKSENQAHVILLVVALVFFAAAIALPFIFSGSGAVTNQAPVEAPKP